jgi:flagellar biosynthesis protein FliR
MPLDARTQLLREGGPIEGLSAAGYIGVLLYVFVIFSNRYIKQYHYLVLLIAFCAMRKLDFDKRFTAMGVLKSKFLVSSDVPLIQKIIGGLVLALLLYCIVRTVLAHGRDLLRRLFNPALHQWGILLGLACMVISKSVDGLGRKVKGWTGYELDSVTVKNASAVEECLELFIPVFFLLAFLSFARFLAEPGELRKNAA